MLVRTLIVVLPIVSMLCLLLWVAVVLFYEDEDDD